jgi:hypothetical protein
VKGKKLVEPAEVTDDEEEYEAYFMDQEFSSLYDEDVWECLECYLNLPGSEHPENNPLSYAYIHEKQQEDDALLALQAKFPNNYVNMELDDEGDDIICYKKHPDRDDWKIALPDSVSMVPEAARWFHHVLGHPGQTRMRDTLQAIVDR